MGAIQQAFNQILNIGAIAISPSISEITKKRAAEAQYKREQQAKQEDVQKKAEQAEIAAHELETLKGEVKEAGRSLDKQLAALEPSEKAAKEYYEKYPSKEGFDQYYELRRQREEVSAKIAARDKKAAEHAAKKAAAAMAQQQQQYKDQSIAALRETVKTAQSQYLGTREAK